MYTKKCILTTFSKKFAPYAPLYIKNIGYYKKCTTNYN